MIWESSYWKKELLRTAEKLRRRKGQRRWSERSKARLEQQIMLGFYSIRKLIESAKLSDKIINQQLDLTTYAWLGNRAVTKMNWDDIDRHYDLKSPGGKLRSVLYVCHQFVHSFVFLPLLLEDGGLFGILFCSDRERHRCLFLLEIDRIIALFDEVGLDRPSQVRGRFNPRTQDFDFIFS